MKSEVRFFILTVISILVVSCRFFEPKSDLRAVAKVNDVYLYENEVENFKMPSGLTEKDSISILNAHIDDWAANQLLLQKAYSHIKSEKQEEFNKLVEDYKIELFVSAYENAYVQKVLNTSIDQEEIDTYLKENKESFLLNEDLIKVRFIHLPLVYSNTSATRKAFTRFNDEDVDELDKIKLSFVNSRLNADGDWITYESFLTEIPSLAFYNKRDLLVKGKYFQFNDKKGKYLIKFTDVITAGKPSPVSYVESSIKQIILNKRKIKLKKQLEKEIITDALQKKEYQIFE